MISPNSHIEFVTVTRGGGEGLLAVVNFDGEPKYYELAGLQSLLKRYQYAAQQTALQAAIDAIQSTVDLDQVAEFEGGPPVQGSLF